jgi:hypothetical protein
MNHVVGWWSLVAGVATGLVMGLWSFDGPLAVPVWLGDYGDTSRRLARLGHIAFLGLGILNILVARELPAIRPERRRRIASFAMNAGNLLMPLALFAAAAFPPVKYALAIPSILVFVALTLVASGVGAGRLEGEHRDADSIRCRRSCGGAPKCHPDRIAAQDLAGTHRVTYCELGEAAARGAAVLERCGLEPGDRVMLSADSGPDWVAALLAIANADLVAVPIPATTPPGLALMAARFTGVRA